MAFVQNLLILLIPVHQISGSMKREICVIAFLCGFTAFSLAQVKPVFPDSIIGYYLTGSDSVVDSRRVYTYDQNGWLLRTDSYDRAVPWTYQESWLHYEYTYDPAGNLKTDSLSEPHTAGEWLPLIKSEYSYTDRNLPSVTYKWYRNFSKNVWGDPYKTEYQYDENWSRVAFVRYKWVESRQEWTLSGVPHTYQYNDSGRLIRENYTAIDVDISMDFQLEYSYPADTLRVIRTFKKQPKDTVWSLNLTEEKIYRPDGRIKNQTVYSMNYEDGSQNPMSKTIWQYQENGSVQLKTDYLRDGNRWLLSVRTHYYYPSVLTSIGLAPEAKDWVYPNPTTGTVWLSDAPDPDRVSVYHQNGQFMRTFTSPGPSLDLSFLQPGIYLLVIESSGKAARRIKIIKVGCRF